MLRQGWPRVLLWPDARQDPAPRRGPAPPADYAANLGKGFDGRTCSFLRLNYEELKAKTLAGGLKDEQLLAWAEEKGGRRSDEECEVWNSFMMKRGWRDDVVPLLTKRIQESGLGDRTILTMFDYIDFDEGRDTVGSRLGRQSRDRWSGWPAVGRGDTAGADLALRITPPLPSGCSIRQSFLS